MQSIRLINHASVLISDQTNSILSDPWYEGSSFNDGWELIYQNDKNYIKKLLNEITHIWISHEHPDHFSIKFFKTYKTIINKNNIQILFQQTKDKRVYKFLTSNNFNVIQLKNKKYYKINDNFYIKLIKSDFYDSALILKLGNKTIVNLNDCPFEKSQDIKSLLNHVKEVDVLLSQFSYAAWKGGKENKSWRENSAYEKLKVLENQVKILNAKHLIPFASYIYFSHVENKYMNDSINTPEKIKKFSKILSEKSIILRPEEEQQIKNLKQDDDSIFFWKKAFNQIPYLNYNAYTKSYNIKELEEGFVKFKNRVLQKNSYLLVLILSKIKFLSIFSKLNIYLYDIDLSLEISIITGLAKIDKHENQIIMHSNSLYFIFLNEFGYDTLTVNGNFEASKKEFLKMSKFFAIGNLNALGISLSIKSIINPAVYLIFIKRLLKVSKKLS